MQLAVFYLAEAEDKTIEINSAQVLAIEPQGEVTKILLAVTGDDGQPLSYTVAHESNVVEHRLGAGNSPTNAP